MNARKRCNAVFARTVPDEPLLAALAAGETLTAIARARQVRLGSVCRALRYQRALFGARTNCELTAKYVQSKFGLRFTIREVHR